MTVGVDDHLVAGTAEDAQGDLVALRAGRDEHPRLMTEALGGHLLQPAHGGVLAVDVVPDLGGGHGGAHRRGGTGDGVGSEVGDGRGHGRARL